MGGALAAVWVMNSLLNHLSLHHVIPPAGWSHAAYLSPSSAEMLQQLWIQHGSWLVLTPSSQQYSHTVYVCVCVCVCVS